MANWPKNLALAVLGCTFAIVVLIGFVLVGLYQVDQKVQDQGEVLDNQVRAQRVSACTSEYTATYTAWDAEAARLFGALISASAAGSEDPDPVVVQEYTTAVGNATEMTRRRIGLASLVGPGGDFTCPTIPQYLTVEPVDPTRADRD